MHKNGTMILKIRNVTTASIACALGLLVFRGCGGTNIQVPAQARKEKIANAAISLRDSTGWTHFSVQIGESDEGTTIIVSALPGTVEGHITYHIRKDGVVEEWESP